MAPVDYKSCGCPDKDVCTSGFEPWSQSLST
jgi:hypothetical protein